MNSIVRPILMKKLLESEICESVNSAPCTVHREKVNKCRLKKKKKKKEENVENENADAQTLKPNEYLIVLLII